MRTRIVLVVLVALLALPIPQISSPVVAKQQPRTVTRTFRNTTSINLPTAIEDAPVSASNLYPSTIKVSGLKGTIRDVNLRLTNLTHTYPADVQVLLVGPSGQTAIVMAGIGGSTGVANVTLRLDDEAAAALPETTILQSGAFRPTQFPGNAIVFIAPAPSATANSALWSSMAATRMGRGAFSSRTGTDQVIPAPLRVAGRSRSRPRSRPNESSGRTTANSGAPASNQGA